MLRVNLNQSNQPVINFERMKIHDLKPLYYVARCTAQAAKPEAVDLHGPGDKTE